ncbi:toll/interleukin-1 receptor domain-containing protein [Sorangium sp. So ce118]
MSSLVVATSVLGVTTNHEGKAEVPALKRMQALHEAVLGMRAPERPRAVGVTRNDLVVPEVLHVDHVPRLGRSGATLSPPKAPEPDVVSSAVRRKLRLLCSYVSADERMLDRLAVHLRPLEQEKLIEIWHERMISPGEEWDKKIERHVEEADIILLLISADFIASERNFEIVVRRALERHDADQAAVVPILIRPCILSPAPLARLKALPRSGLPVASYADPEAAWAQVADELRKLITMRV